MSYVNESCHTWMSHVTREWVMSHVDESFHKWISHVTQTLVSSRIAIVANDPAGRVKSTRALYLMSHVTHIYAPRHTCEYVMQSKVNPCTKRDESCHTYIWAMPHVWTRHMSHATRVNTSHEPCHTCEHVTHIYEPCHTCEHVTQSNVTQSNVNPRTIPDESHHLHK